MAEDMNENPCKTIITLMTGLALLAGLLVSTACYTAQSSMRDSKDDQIAAFDSPDQSLLVPVLYVVFDDKSGSVASGRITPLRERDLLTLIDSLRLTGGELAFGLIGDSTDRPLLRIRIPIPPARPVKAKVQNAFERAEQDALFQERIEKFEAESKQRNNDIDQRVAAFMSAARPRLQERSVAKTSPINSALSRSELFLNEPATAWLRPPHRYIILNSDAIDTTKSALVPIKSGAKLVLINGTGSLGILGAQNPLRFESVQAALDFK
jgi:hypothetical protein